LATARGLKQKPQQVGAFYKFAF